MTQEGDGPLDSQQRRPAANASHQANLPQQATSIGRCVFEDNLASSAGIV